MTTRRAFLGTFLEDWKDRGAQSRRPASLPLSAIAAQFFTLSTTVLTLLDRFTSTFAPLFTYRVRTSVLILAAFSCLIVLSRVIGKKEGRPASRTYVYASSQRRLAKLAFIVTCLILPILGYSASYFRSYKGPIEGFLRTTSGRPLFLATVSFLDLDGNPIGPETISDNQTGHFILDPLPTTGRAAYLKVTTKECERTEPLISNGFFLRGKNVEISHESVRIVLVVRSGCSG